MLYSLFGDEWSFDVMVESVDAIEDSTKTAKYTPSGVYKPICEATVAASKSSWLCVNVNNRISSVYTNRSNICHRKQLFLLCQMIHVAANLDLSMAHAVDICEILPICLDLVGKYINAVDLFYWISTTRKITIFPGMRKVNPLAELQSIKLENLTVEGMASVRAKGVAALLFHYRIPSCDGNWLLFYSLCRWKTR